MVLSGFGLVVFTTQLKVAVVDRHVPRNLHIAPGALEVVVRVTALVAGQSDFRDELLVLAEGLHLWQRPLQTGVASQRKIQVASVVDAVIWEALAGSDRFRGHSGRDEHLTFTEERA